MTRQGFFEQAAEKFRDMAGKFNFSIAEIHEYVVELRSDKCIVTFAYDRGEMSCMFSNPKSNKTKYHAYLVYRKLYPGDEVFRDAPDYASVPETLSYYNQLLVNKLQAVLSGDFSWSNEMDVDNTEMQRKAKFLIDHFPADHPIKRKFWNGDPSWEQDLKAYEKQHSGFLTKFNKFFRKVFYLFCSKSAPDK